MKEKISVIVPIHNAEKYLETCIKSIIGQTYRNLEIILVDDCSDDSSAAICDSFATQDERIRVIHREVKGGEGGAKARNNGISEATGELMYFIDSDDYIDSDMLTQMYQIMCREQSDCVVSSFHYIDAEGKELPWSTPQISDYHVMSGKDAAKIFLTTLDIEGFSWNKLIRRELVRKYDICFDESMNSFVDMYGMFRAVFYSEKVSFYHACPYYYRQHNVSCVHTMDKRKLGNFKRVIGQICEFANKNDMSEESRFFGRYRMMMQLFDAVKAKKNYDKITWEQIELEYKWSAIFEESLWKVAGTIFKNIDKNKLKTGIKLFCVWFNFK